MVNAGYIASFPAGRRGEPRKVHVVIHKGGTANNYLYIYIYMYALIPVSVQNIVYVVNLPYTKPPLAFRGNAGN